jgi:hypothetical protein
MFGCVGLLINHKSWQASGSRQIRAPYISKNGTLGKATEFGNRRHDCCFEPTLCVEASSMEAWFAIKLIPAIRKPPECPLLVSRRPFLLGEKHCEVPTGTDLVLLWHAILILDLPKYIPSISNFMSQWRSV